MTHRSFYIQIFSQRPVQDYVRQHVTRISTRSSHKDVYERGFHLDIARSSHKDPYHPLPRSCNDVLERTLSGSPQDLLIRACTRSYGPLREDFTRISTRSSQKDLYKGRLTVQDHAKTLGEDSARISTKSFHKDLYKILFHEPHVLCEPEHPKCTWKFSEPFTVEFTRKCRAPEVSRAFCASLRTLNALGRLRRAILRQNLEDKSRAPY